MTAEVHHIATDEGLLNDRGCTERSWSTVRKAPAAGIIIEQNRRALRGRSNAQARLPPAMPATDASERSGACQVYLEEQRASALVLRRACRLRGNARDMARHCVAEAASGRLMSRGPWRCVHVHDPELAVIALAANDVACARSKRSEPVTHPTQ